MKFSLIVPTIHRVQETERLFQSLLIQEYKDFEVILVDQNPDDRLADLVNVYKQHFPILRLRETKLGLSHARNVALPHVKGDIIGLPDDDCIYLKETLSKVNHFFSYQPQWDGLVGRIYDLEEDAYAFGDCGDAQSQKIDHITAYKVCASSAIFFKASVGEKISFDESLGVGANTLWCAGEETDFVFQCLDVGYQFYFDENLIIRHPNPRKNNPFFRQIKREYTYGVGRGYFLATHSLASSFLKAERYDPFQKSLTNISQGNWRLASYLLTNGIGAEIGYRAGSKKKEEYG